MQNERRNDKKLKYILKMYKLNKGCVICGYKKCAAALDFHHIDNDKLFNVSQMIREGCSLNKIMEEIKKCELLCANCHRELHWEQKKGIL